MNPQSYYGGNVIVPQNKPSFFRSKKGLMLIVLAVLLLAAIITGVLSSGTSSGEDKFVDLTFVKHDAENSYRLLGPSITSEMDFATWQKRVEKYKSLYNGYSKESSVTRDEEDEKVTLKHVTYVIKAKDDKSTTLVLEYQKELDGNDDFILQDFTLGNASVEN